MLEKLEELKKKTRKKRTSRNAAGTQKIFLSGRNLRERERGARAREGK